MAILERVAAAWLTEAGVLARHAQAVTVATTPLPKSSPSCGTADGLVRLVAFPRHPPVPRLISALATSHPGITLTIRGRAAQRSRRSAKTADIALTFSYPGDRTIRTDRARGLTVRGAGRDELMLVLPQGHLPVQGVADLADET